MFLLTMILTFLLGCTPHDDVIAFDDGMEPDEEKGCLDISENMIDFGSFDLKTPPESISIFIDTYCGSPESDFWTLDDPDQAFSVTMEQDGETIILVINTEIEATGTWESQLLLKDWATEKIHRIQLFAEAYEDEANEE